MKYLYCIIDFLNGFPTLQIESGEIEQIVRT